MMFQNYCKELIASPLIVFRNFVQNRHILLQMIKTEIKGRFAGSIGGLLWHFIHPVFMLLVYLFVFVYIFKLRIGAYGGAWSSALYIMSGIFPWFIISEGLLRGTSSLIENAGLIQKTSFPTEILIGKSVLAPVVSYGIALILLTFYQVLNSGNLHIILFLPLILFIQIIFTLGIAFFTSSISVFLRDIIQFMQILINFWIYLTPILYPADMLPSWGKKAMLVNPLYPLVSVYQTLFLSGEIQFDHIFFLFLLWSFLFFFVGAFFFNKLKLEFADWL